MPQTLRAFRGALSDIDLNLLREFLAIVEAGGLTAAEARLGKGKSAISLGLSKLEGRLGIKLCDRGRSGFRLTEQGRIVHSATMQLMSEIGRFSDLVGTAARKLEGEVTFLADDSFAFHLERPLARTIARISETFPGLKLNIRMTAPDRIFSSVLEGSADLGFTALIRPSDALEAVAVCGEEMGLFCARGHPLFGERDEAIDHERPKEFNFVAVSVIQDETFVEFFRDLTVKATAPTILSRLMLILSAHYLGFVPVAFARHWVDQGVIREIILPNSRRTNDCYIIHRRARPLGLAGTILQDILREELRSPISS